jgi:hypothetical protein
MWSFTGLAPFSLDFGLDIDKTFAYEFGNILPHAMDRISVTI